MNDILQLIEFLAEARSVEQIKEKFHITDYVALQNIKTLQSVGFLIEHSKSDSSKTKKQITYKIDFKNSQIDIFRRVSKMISSRAVFTPAERLERARARSREYQRQNRHKNTQKAKDIYRQTINEKYLKDKTPAEVEVYWIKQKRKAENNLNS